MQNEFSKTYTLRTSDFNYNRTLRPSSVLDLFQDAAGIHAKLLGSGIDDFKRKGIVWVIIGIKYKILKKIDMYSDLTVTTWPLKPSLVKYQRDFSVTCNGEVVIKGESMWSIIDAEERKISLQKDVYPATLDFKQEKAFEERFSKIVMPPFEEFTYKGTRKATNSDIDVNGHVNNTRYLTFITDTCGVEAENYDCLKIEYHKELLLGEEVSIYADKTENSLFVEGKRGDDLIFSVEYSK